jgi:chromosome segregation ATPase
MSEQKRVEVETEIGEEKTPLEEEVERLNDLLRTMEGTLEEIKAQRDQERRIREGYEKEMVELKGRAVGSDAKMREMEAKVAEGRAEVELANQKRRQAVERADKLNREVEMLRRLNREFQEHLPNAEQ